MIYKVNAQGFPSMAAATLAARHVRRILMGQTVDLSLFVPRQEVDAGYVPLDTVHRDYVPVAVVQANFIHRDSIRARMRSFNIRISNDSRD